jgi:hypothetical protein
VPIRKKQLVHEFLKPILQNYESKLPKYVIDLSKQTRSLKTLRKGYRGSENEQLSVKKKIKSNQVEEIEEDHSLRYIVHLQSQRRNTFSVIKYQYDSNENLRI